MLLWTLGWNVLQIFYFFAPDAQNSYLACAFLFGIVDDATAYRIIPMPALDPAAITHSSRDYPVVVICQWLCYSEANGDAPGRPDVTVTTGKGLLIL